MTDADALNLISRYEKSWYSDIDHIDPRNIGGKRVGQVDMVAGMLENIDEAKWNRDGIRKRYEAAQRDGLFDLAALATIKDKDIREKWIMAIDTQQGDKGRCIGELKHWREYLVWAKEQQRATAADRRLPPERNDDGNEQRAIQAGDVSDHPDQQPDERGVRYGAL